MNLPDLTHSATFTKLIASVLLVVLTLLLRAVVTRALRRQMSQSEIRRKWLVSIRNVTFLFLVLGLGAVWAEALRTIALSIVAFAVAVVIATKELIQCISGSVLRTASNPFSIGDRVEIGSHRGDVIDQNLLTTTLLEVGPGRAYHLRTGRTIVVPNSKLLDTPVVNESYMKQFVLHVFSIPLKGDQDWQKAERILLKAARAECGRFLDQVAEHMKDVEQKHALKGLPVQPRVSIQIPDTGKISLVVRVPAPVGRQGHVEQSIVRRFLREFGKLEAAAPDKAAEPDQETEPDQGARRENLVVPAGDGRG